jgi:hypothetical protein
MHVAPWSNLLFKVRKAEETPTQSHMPQEGRQAKYISSGQGPCSSAVKCLNLTCSTVISSPTKNNGPISVFVSVKQDDQLGKLERTA